MLPRRGARAAAQAAGLAFTFICTGPAFAQGAAPRAVDFEKGRQQFHRTCAQCHGRNMVNSGITSYDLRKFPVDQEARFIASVSNGKGNMPGYKDALSAEQLHSLWVYVSNRGQAPQ